MHLELRPEVRAIVLVLLILGILFCAYPLTAAVGYALLASLTLANAIVRKKHLMFLAFFVSPLAIVSLIVWPLLVGAPPGKPLGSDPIAALEFAMLAVFRVAFIGAALQLVLLSMKTRELIQCLRSLRLPNDWLIVVLSSLVLIPEMTRKADRMVVAAMSRGLLRSRGFFSRFSLLIVSILPLTAWSLRSALARGVVWQERDFLSNFSNAKMPSSARLNGLDIMVLLSSAIWFLANVAQRWFI